MQSVIANESKGGVRVREFVGQRRRPASSLQSIIFDRKKKEIEEPKIVSSWE